MMDFPCLCLQAKHIPDFSSPEEEVETMLVSLTSYFPGLKPWQITCSNGSAVPEANTSLGPLEGGKVGRNLYLFDISSFR